jgi:hypothetical protein
LPERIVIQQRFREGSLEDVAVAGIENSAASLGSANNIQLCTFFSASNTQQLTTQNYVQ